MKLVVDMNLSPDWVQILVEKGFEALHWSSVGKASASFLAASWCDKVSGGSAVPCSSPL
jgi:hypothetical protein